MPSNHLGFFCCLTDILKFGFDDGIGCVAAAVDVCDDLEGFVVATFGGEPAGREWEWR